MPAGFFVHGVRCGIGRDPHRPDLALIVADRDCAAAGVTTTNRVAAAPVLLSRARLRSGLARAVLINSGSANACTGPEGLAAARETSAAVAEAWGIPSASVLVASTGVIGKPLPVKAIVAGLGQIHRAWRAGRGDARQAARAIMTTDTVSKMASATVRLRGGSVRLWGMAKGSGMIAPNMATMLACVLTDAGVSPRALRSALRRAAERTFNAVTVDGDTSTNDSLFLLASGRGAALRGGAERARFQIALERVCRDLARMIARDGEGATKLVTVEVTGARRESEARAAARTVAESPLVKTALFGADANWGRVLAAVGRSGARFDPNRVSVRFNGLLVARAGRPTEFSEAAAHRALQRSEVTVGIDLGGGPGAASMWTCDLTDRYIAINAHYRT